MIRVDSRCLTIAITRMKLTQKSVIDAAAWPFADSS